MKKISLIILICLLPLMAFGQTNCPLGQTECNTPCANYIDENEDDECDFIQSKSEKKEILPALKKEITIQKKQTVKAAITPKKIIEPVKITPPKTIYKKKSYHLFPISVSLLFLYIITIILYKKKMIEPRTHFKFWNLALLLTFLISALFGILLVIMINYGLRFKLPFNILLWHTEAGIAMFMISLFHIHWHWRYLKNIFKIQK